MTDSAEPEITPINSGPRSWAWKSVVFLVQLYRTWVSPMRLPTCRFEPTCSAYAVEALTTHGLLYGGWLSIIRLLKCGPWHKPGYDPVPERTTRVLSQLNPLRRNTSGAQSTKEHTVSC
ncbi:membrane protein insertion efficiency factor YidD [Jongsikchunia kroppenstedtii]|uniref:membrane protein insertion efficiency factor YidD n=1 Tax=Jongsikchunia kroppenstedtii TaxID=1121721 RepID=UPI00035EC2BB|nr:membrane protein insertion efficiency factor YidD [Jongsikchunia kroppenstedtii]